MRFKIATEDWEFEAIHRLNYETFVDEIPQHRQNAERRLVDRFHAENTYAICLVRDELAGMVCGRTSRPFSLDGKLPDLDSYLPEDRSPFEIRLLAVRKERRAGRVFVGLAAQLWRHFREKGCDLALISGTTRQLRLYRHLGFVPFGPLVGDADARFQPMYLELERFLEQSTAITRRAAAQPAAANFLCGPVQVGQATREAFLREPLSHRSARFAADLRATKRLLCALTGAAHVEILLGSGTLANDVVAAELAGTGGRGLVLSNGEFGERLADHAMRHHLECEVLRWPWGEPLDAAALDERLRRGAFQWLWAVHCETSTGALNDLPALKAACRDARAALCLDCISSIGTMPVDLRGVHLASCVSGKGLASFPGLSMVFYDALRTPPRDSLPRYLDLRYYASHAGPAFTISTNLVYALQAALTSTSWLEKFAGTAAASQRLRRCLRELGFRVVAADAAGAHGVITLALEADLPSAEAGERLREQGLLLGYESGYLLERNWIQIGLMGVGSDVRLNALMHALARLRGHRPPRKARAASAQRGLPAYTAPR